MSRTTDTTNQTPEQAHAYIDRTDDPGALARFAHLLVDDRLTEINNEPGTSYDLDDGVLTIRRSPLEVEPASGPTVYAKLMDAALKQPRTEVRADVEAILRGHGVDALTESVIDHLNRAYVAGVRDGYADAVIRADSALTPNGHPGPADIPDNPDDWPVA